MSATELIKQAAALPQRERTLFEQLSHAMKNGSRASGPANRSNWPDFSEGLRGIYGDKIAPDSQKIIDEGRGDRRWRPILTPPSSSGCTSGKRPACVSSA